MCAGCEADVAAAGEFIDLLMEAHQEHVDATQEDSSAQQCIRLACATRDSYLDDQGIEALQRICLALAVATHRLTVLQQINGGAL